MDISDQLIIACSKKNNLENCKRLIELKANINYEDKYGSTALLWASITNNFEIVEYLLEKRANINKRNIHGNNALFMALDYRNIEMAIYLIKKGSNINCKNNRDDIPLDMISWTSNFERIKLSLLKNGSLIKKFEIKFLKYKVKRRKINYKALGPILAMIMDYL